MEINMKISLLLFSLFAVGFGASRPSLRVRYGVEKNPGTDYFVELPQTVSDAVAANWALTERPSGPLPQLVLYCSPERIVCLLFEDTGHVAGLQVALPQKEFTDAALDWETQGFTEWTPPVADGHEVVTYWAIQQYYVSEAYLKKSKEERLALRNPHKTLQNDEVWVTGFNRQLVKIPTCENEIAKNKIFTIQACFPAMGLHYFYNASTELPCDSDLLLPWFVLMHHGEMAALGFVTYGQLPIKEGRRDYFERPCVDIIKAIVPRGPQCLYDLVASPGMLSMHVYFVDEPWLIKCDDQ